MSELTTHQTDISQDDRCILYDVKELFSLSLLSSPSVCSADEAVPLGCNRQAWLNLLVASAMRAPHLPNVLARAEMSRTVSCNTLTLAISASTYEEKYGESAVKLAAAVAVA